MHEMLLKIEKARKEFSEQPIFCFSTDIDWASEVAIKKSMDWFLDKDIPIMAFLTHKSQVIDEFGEKINVGPHPNYMPDSSQGKSFDEIIDFCLNLTPDAIGFRSHRYFDVNDILEKFCKHGMKYDSNVCTLLDNMQPFLHRTGLIRFPTFFEDGAYLLNKGSFDFLDVDKYFFTGGIKVINIHPMHLMLNTPNFMYMRNIKDSLTREQWNNIDEDIINEYKNKGAGITTFIEQMVEQIAKRGIKTMQLDDVYKHIISI